MTLDRLQGDCRRTPTRLHTHRLVCHPDKGGDPSVFREVQSAFEVMRALFDSGEIQSFCRQSNLATSSNFRDACTAGASNPTPS